MHDDKKKPLPSANPKDEHFSGIEYPNDPLEGIESETGEEMSGQAHKEAEKPTELPKDVRSHSGESYRPMRQD